MHLLDAAAPDGMRLYAIGDIHGRFDLLRAMHAMIRGEIARDPPADWRIIHVGDYVDRGPQSREVLGFLARAVHDDSRMIALAGNHEVGMLDFLDDPSSQGIFARNGGRETAMSYGVDGDFSSELNAYRTAQSLLRTMPEEHLSFLRALPRSVAFGDVFFCHAGVRPGIGLDSQDPEDLIWIREKFLNWPHLHEKLIVHGHTPAHEPELMSNRVNVDTGAWMGRPLTAIEIDGRRKRIFQVEPGVQRVAWTTP